MFGRKKGTGIPGYEYSTKEAREDTAGALFAKAKNARTVRETEWVRYNDYYNFIHEVSDEVREAIRDSEIGWDAAVVPDPYIQVESQIDPVVPEPEFRGRDDDLDSQKAKQREYAVKYVCQANRLPDLNTSNERRLTKYGDAFWKVYWDETMPCGPIVAVCAIACLPSLLSSVFSMIPQATKMMFIGTTLMALTSVVTSFAQAGMVYVMALAVI